LSFGIDISEAKKCGNNLWLFIGWSLICKSYAANNKVELLHESLEEAFKVALEMKGVDVIVFISVCRDNVHQELKRMERKRQENNLLLNRRKTKSIGSRSVMSVASLMS